MTRTRIAFLLCAALGAAGGAWYYLNGNAPTGAAKKPAATPAVPVKLAKAEVRDIPLRLEVTGRTEAYESVTLKARVEGQVSRVPFVEGQHVRQGDLLVQLDPADFQARQAQAEANLAKSQAQAAKARADVERYIALREKGFVSEEKVGEMRTAAAAAEAVAKADGAAAELARLQLSYTSLRAPFAGVVGAKLVFPGAAVKLNDTALAVVNRVRPLYVGFAVPEKYLPQLQAGMRTKGAALRASIALPGGDTRWDGEVRFLDNSVDVATGTIQLKAVLPNLEEALAPGQFVAVSLVLDTLKDAIVVPAEAIQQGAEGSFVFVARDDSSVEVRKVRVDATQKTVAVVGQGLNGGETVVTEGQLRLTAGARIRPAGAPEGKSGAAGAKPESGAQKPEASTGKAG